MSIKLFSKRLAAAMVVAAVVLAGTAGTAVAQTLPAPDYAWYGDGSKTTYSISTAAELVALANIVNGTAGMSGPAQDDFSGKTVSLEQYVTIDLKDAEWTPIGGATYTYESGGYTDESFYTFSGTFRGNYGTIKGLKINNSNRKYQGLFGAVNGTVNYLRVEGDIKGGSVVGGIVGVLLGTVDNCSFKGSVSGIAGDSYSGIGGIVGKLSYAGGEYSKVTNSNNTGNISGAIGGYSGMGGIVGTTFSNNLIENCYNTGNVSGTSSGDGNGIGGIVGRAPSTNIKYCYNTGNVTGRNNVGGIRGSGSAGVYYSYNTGNITGIGEVGGITGGGERIWHEGCYNTGNITGTTNVGGIIGSTYGDGLDMATNCYNSGDVSGITGVGGILGQSNYYVTISNCVSLGLIVKGHADSVGRIVGHSTYYTSNLINNKARSDMKIGPSGKEGPVGGAAEDTNGESIDLGAAFSVVFADFNSVDSIMWDIGNSDILSACDELPTLKYPAWQQSPAPRLPAHGGCHAVTYAQSTGGTIKVTDAGNKNVTTGTLVPYNALLTVTASPATNYRLKSLAINGDPQYESGDKYYVLGATTIVGTFELSKYPVSFDAPIGGSLIVTTTAGDTVKSGDSIAHGTELTITALANTGYSFSTLTVGVIKLTSGGKHVVSEATSIVAVFTPDTYKVTCTAPENGTLNVRRDSSSGAVLTTGTSVEHGTMLIITATPDDGYILSSLTVNDSVLTNKDADNTGTVNMSHTVTGAVTISAVFTLDIVSPTFVPVTTITGIPDTITAGATIPLADLGTVVPADATNKKIVWSVIPGTTGADVFADILIVPASGMLYLGATIADGKADGAKYEQLFTIIVAPSSSVLTPDRNIPVTPDNGASVIAPVSPVSLEVTAGPNPVTRGGDAVQFFASGKSNVTGTLTVYDATGNAVRKININAGGAPTVANVQSVPRAIAEWDLRDANGRLVPAGTYLVRGSLTANGKREKVSQVIGVR